MTTATVGITNLHCDHCGGNIEIIFDSDFRFLKQCLQCGRPYRATQVQGQKVRRERGRR